MNPENRRRVILGLAALTALVLASGLLLVLVPRWAISANDFARKDGSLDAAALEKARNDVRTAALQLVGLLAVVSGAIFTGRSYYTNRQGQITDRFTKAIDQLGSDATDIKLGGIYALERIARESRYDHGPITEVLTAFARGNASAAQRRDRNGEARESAVDVAQLSRAGTRLEVQAAISVLGRRRLTHEGSSGPAKLDLRGIQIHRASLRGDDSRTTGRFDRADLEGAPRARSEGCRRTRIVGAPTSAARIWENRPRSSSTARMGRLVRTPPVAEEAGLGGPRSR